jgi:hypothetical protein
MVDAATAGGVADLDDVIAALQGLTADELVAAGTVLVKLCFSVSRREQLTCFTIRRIDPVRQWKRSPMHLASLDRWDKDAAVVGSPDPLLVGSSAVMARDVGEHTAG